MKTLVSYLILIGTCGVCAYPIGWVTSRIRNSLILSGYSATDPVQVRYLWLFFTLLLIAGAWIHIVPHRQ